MVFKIIDFVILLGEYLISYPLQLFFHFFLKQKSNRYLTCLVWTLLFFGEIIPIEIYTSFIFFYLFSFLFWKIREKVSVSTIKPTFFYFFLLSFWLFYRREMFQDNFIFILELFKVQYPEAWIIFLYLFQYFRDCLHKTVSFIWFMLLYLYKKKTLFSLTVFFFLEKIQEFLEKRWETLEFVSFRLILKTFYKPMGFVKFVNKFL